MFRSRKLFALLALSVAIAIGLIALYSVFEYTLVPEMRERIAKADDLDEVALGRLLFQTRGCAACHSLVRLSSSNIGPALNEVVANASADEIAASIVNPDAQISTRCVNMPCAAGIMPEFGNILDEREINALVAFLLQYSSVEFDMLRQNSD